MSDYWDNNKDSIKKSAKTTGKYAWAGTKAISKAGYHAVKGTEPSKSKDKEGSHSPEVVDTRSLKQLDDVQKFPPPPLKPGQMQYQSEKTRNTMAHPTMQPVAPPVTQGQPQGQYQQQMMQGQPQGQYQQQMMQGQPQVQYQQPQPQSVQYQPQPPVLQTQQSYQQGYQYQPPPPPPQQVQQSQYVQYEQQYQYQQPPQAQQVQQPAPPPLRETIAVPPTQVTVEGTTVNLPAYNVDKQKAINLSGQLFSHVMQSQQGQQGQQGLQQVPTQMQPSTQPVITQNMVSQGAQALPGMIRMASQPQVQQQPQVPTPMQQSTQPQVQQMPEQQVQQFQPVQQMQPVRELATPEVQQLDYNNPYYQGAVAQQQPQAAAVPTEFVPTQYFEPVSAQFTQYTSIQSQGPPLAPSRDYERAPMNAPMSLVQTSTQAQLPQMQQRDIHSPSPDLSNLPIPPRRTTPGSPIVTATPQMVSRVSSTTVPIVNSPLQSGVVVGAGPPAQDLQKEGQPEEPVDRGIAGSYEYKIDVKFAPPPVHRDTGPKVSLKKPWEVPRSTKTSSANSLSSHSSSRPKPVGSNSTQLVNRVTPSPPTDRPIPAPPARTMSVNFPPPPRPSNPMAHQTNEQVHHNNGVSSPQTSHDIPMTPPPEYSSGNASIHEVQHVQQQVQKPPIQQPMQFDLSKFPPPPKPFKKVENEAFMKLKIVEPVPMRGGEEENFVAEDEEEEEVVVKTTKLKPVVPGKKPTITGNKPVIPNKTALNVNRFSPATRAPLSQTLDDNDTPVKSKPVPGPKPPIPGPKPTADAELKKKKTPPVLKPKPDLSKKVPPVKPKPKALQSIASHSETASRTTEEDVEDNPFTRYLKAAVPQEDDRFHRR